VSYVAVRNEKHAMLHRSRVWHGVVTGFVAATLLGVPPETVTAAAEADIVSEILAGKPSLVV
jgi:membrane protein YqaA with SNARE-associated domain